MSYHNNLVLLAKAAMVDLRSTDAGDAGRRGGLYACEISRGRSKRRVTHAWLGVSTLLEILVPSLRH
jgi:hypothetical protein